MIPGCAIDFSRTESVSYCTRDIGIGCVRVGKRKAFAHPTLHWPGRLAYAYIRIYINFPDIGFDPAKDARNVAHRGLSFARAADFDWAGADIIEAVRFAYPERRFVAVGYLDGRLNVQCFIPPRAASG